jgi:uncharacterized protein YfkK (UPF0435 family)
MGRQASTATVEKILGALSCCDKLTFAQIADKSQVSWDSVKRYIEMFVKLNLVREYNDSGKLTYQKMNATDKDTLFAIPLSEDKKNTIRRLYATIKQVWPQVSNNSLSRTAMQKVAVSVAEIRFKDIPAAWYLYGKVLLMPYEQLSKAEPFNEQDIVSDVRSACTEYSTFKNTEEIKEHQYEKEKNRLYLTKEKLSHLLYQPITPETKNQLRQCLNEFAFSWERKENNSDILMLMEDFCSTGLSILRNADDNALNEAKIYMMNSFEALWDLIATYEFYDSLTKRYDKELLNDFLSEKIKVLKEMALESLEALHEHEPKLEFPDNEILRKLKSLLSSVRELSPEEKKARAEEIEKIRKEKGDEGVQDFIIRKFGL